jgi:hypothetical protein
LSSDTCRRLVRDFHGRGFVTPDDYGQSDLDALVTEGILAYCPVDPSDSAAHVSPASHMVRVLRAISWAGSPLAIAAVGALAIGLVTMLSLGQPSPVFSITAYSLDHVPAFATMLPSLLLFVAVFACTVLVHEFGHAVTSVYCTGTVGGLGVSVAFGIPAVTIDVSALSLATGRARALVWFAGPLFQLVFAAFLMLAWSDNAPVHSAALLAGITALLSLWPYPGNDGHRLLEAFANRPLSPRIHGDALDLTFLAVVSCTLLGWLSVLIQGMVAWAHDFPQSAPVTGIVMTISIVAWLIAAVAVVRAGLRREVLS